MHKGKIVLVPFPFTDLSGQKIRPCIVLWNSPKGEDCIVAFISSKKDQHDSFSVKIKPSTTNGLKSDSVIKFDKMATLQKKIILGEIGILESETLIAVDHKLKSIFKLK